MVGLPREVEGFSQPEIRTQGTRGRIQTDDKYPCLEVRFGLALGYVSSVPHSPFICALTLDQGQSSARVTSRARTGFRLT